MNLIYSLSLINKEMYQSIEDLLENVNEKTTEIMNDDTGSELLFNSQEEASTNDSTAPNMVSRNRCRSLYKGAALT